MELPDVLSSVVRGDTNHGESSWDKVPGKPNVLIYAHYDVQPVKESEWTIPPEKLYFLINKY